jgi:16S rRNA (cytidine1402-2'-O)-methyltransferase
MGTLYIVGVPVVNAEDLTLRARRVLCEVACIAVDDLDAASRLLVLRSVDAPVCRSSDTASVLRALDGGDVAFLCSEHSPCPTYAASQLVSTAIAQGHRAVPVPGPVFPLTALVLSGLPAGSFVFLDCMPDEPGARASLIASLQQERRTLVVTASSEHLAGLLSELHRSFGERPIVISRAGSQGSTETWRGTLDTDWGTGRVLFGGDTGQDTSPDPSRAAVIVIGGASRSAGRWKEERLRTAVLSRLERGLGVKETSQQLADASGWTRREVYQIALDTLRRGKHDSPAGNVPRGHVQTQEGGSGNTHDEPG